LKEIRVLKLEFCILSLELDDDFFYSWPLGLSTFQSFPCIENDMIFIFGT
jgi:hypothetical protein